MGLLLILADSTNFLIEMQANRKERVAVGLISLCRSADILVRFGVDENEEADKNVDKNVRAPKAEVAMVNKSEMRPRLFSLRSFLES